MPSQEYIDSHQHEVDTGADNIPSQYDNDDRGIHLDACECMHCQNDDSDDMAMYESDDNIPF